MCTEDELLSEAELRRIERLPVTSSLPDRLDLPELIAQQDFRPLTDPLALREGIWPEDESVDDFLAAREAWRHEGEDAWCFRH